MHHLNVRCQLDSPRIFGRFKFWLATDLIAIVEAKSTRGSRELQRRNNARRFDGERARVARRNLDSAADMGQENEHGDARNVEQSRRGSPARLGRVSGHRRTTAVVDRASAVSDLAGRMGGKLVFADYLHVRRAGLRRTGESV